MDVIKRLWVNIDSWQLILVIAVNTMLLAVMLVCTGVIGQTCPARPTRRDCPAVL
ncbi:hypothetical protein [Mycobacterium lepromatosis]|uniref:hypothetical protein n=1 Tax=Mycobacterium lepromatosis TaxID=480418 RepID=UPI003B5148D9